MRKKLFRFLFVFALLFGFSTVLASCNNNDKPADPTPTPVDPTPTPVDPTPTPVDPTPTPVDPVDPTPVEPVEPEDPTILKALPEGYYEKLLTSKDGFKVTFEDLEIEQNDSKLTFFDESYIQVKIEDGTLIGNAYLFYHIIDPKEKTDEDQKVYVSIDGENIYYRIIIEEELDFYKHEDFFVDTDEYEADYEPYSEILNSTSLTLNKEGFLTMFLKLYGTMFGLKPAKKYDDENPFAYYDELAATIMNVVEMVKLDNVKTYFDPENPDRITETKISDIYKFATSYLSEETDASELLDNTIAQITNIADEAELSKLTSFEIATKLLDFFGLTKDDLSEELQADYDAENLTVSQVINLEQIQNLTLNQLIYKAIVFANKNNPEAEIPAETEFDVSDMVYNYIEQIQAMEEMAKAQSKKSIASMFEMLGNFVIKSEFESNKITNTTSLDTVKGMYNFAKSLTVEQYANMALADFKDSEGKPLTYEDLLDILNPENYEEGGKYENNKKYSSYSVADIFDSFAGEGSFDKLLAEFAPVEDGQESTRFIDKTFAELYNDKFATEEDENPFATLLAKFAEENEESIGKMTIGEIIDKISAKYPDLTSETIDNTIDSLMPLVNKMLKSKFASETTEEGSEGTESEGSEDTEEMVFDQNSIANMLYMGFVMAEVDFGDESDAINELVENKELTISYLFKTETIRTLSLNDLVEKFYPTICGLLEREYDKDNIPNFDELATKLLSNVGEKTINEALSILLSYLANKDNKSEELIEIDFAETVYGYLSMAKEFTVNNLAAMVLSKTSLGSMINPETFDLYTLGYFVLSLAKDMTLDDITTRFFGKNVEDILTLIDESFNVTFVTDNEADLKELTLSLNTKLVSGKIKFDFEAEYVDELNESLEAQYIKEQLSNDFEEILNDNIFDELNALEDSYVTYALNKEEDKYVGFTTVEINDDYTETRVYRFDAKDLEIDKDYKYGNIWYYSIECSASVVRDYGDGEIVDKGLTTSSISFYYDDDTKTFFNEIEYTEETILEGGTCENPKVVKNTNTRCDEDYHYVITYTAHPFSFDNFVVEENEDGTYTISYKCPDCEREVLLDKNAKTKTYAKEFNFYYDLLKIYDIENKSFGYVVVEDDVEEITAPTEILEEIENVDNYNVTAYESK